MTSSVLFVLWGLAAVASGQSTISTIDKLAFSANAGWIDFRTTATDGTVVTESYLAGNAYAANFGWISLGDGSPGNGYSYSNDSPTDCGVNLSAAGELTGYAYSANVGWIRFEQTDGKPKLDFITGKFTGHAYSANLGWISLDTPSSDLATTTLGCPDVDGDGIGDAYEMAYFGALDKSGATSDYDKDGVSDLKEYLANTSPVDKADLLRITVHTYNIPAKNAWFTFTSKTNRLYTIEHNTDPGGQWVNSNLGTIVPSIGTTTASEAVVYDGGPRGFFRIVAHKPLQP